ncbi:alpha/beta-hydrolase [Auriculariales sp. MPI-PUGE-AT-0066]|nr:alpha/beta-hydrolase [Auriculariales sp. MPI-PUGE-AT-0066]
MSLCKDCFKAVRHDGTPNGKMETIGGVETYVAIPEKEYPKDKAVVFLSDAFGLFVNNKLLTDSFAENGYQTYTPDLFTGDPFTVDMFTRPGFNAMTDWFPKHSPAITRPIVDSFLKGLRERGITTLALTGYCFGARFVFDLAFEPSSATGIRTIVVSHPSMLQVPADFEMLVTKGTAPLLVNTCEKDEQFPIEQQTKADEVLGGGRYKPGYERTYWPGCEHGFTVRGDLSVPEVKAGKEGAFKATIDWFNKYI